MKLAAFALMLCSPLGLLPAVALAGGSALGESVLMRRTDTLLGLWDASFALEASRLMPPPKGLSWRSIEDDEGWSLHPSQQANALREDLLDDGQLAAWNQWMDTVGDDVIPPENLPGELVGYGRGVRAWRTVGCSAALGHFERAAEGTATATSPWPLIAAYMQARCLPGPEETVVAFDHVIRRASAGEADPLSLGPRALSEAAAQHMLLDQPVQAMVLLMQQAALEVPDAVPSLSQSLHQILGDEDVRQQLLGDARTRELVILYALAYMPSATDSSYLPSDWDAALLADIDAAVGVLPAGALTGADRLAALMYRQGRYDIAERFSASASSGLAQWVKAKLAVRRGDLVAARELFSQASASFPARDDWGSKPYGKVRVPAERARAEAGILALHAGELGQSLELFLMAGALYWEDAAYVAERVLTFDELESVVKRLEHITVPGLQLGHEYKSEDLHELDAPGRRGYVVSDPKRSLRNLLARRLMREGRLEPALAHFSDPTMREHAGNYRQLLAEAESAVGTDRARKLFDAAKLARRRGLNMLAFESDPDWALYGGDFTKWSPMRDVLGEHADDEEDDYWPRSDDSALINPLERERVRQHRSLPEPRFSYRLTAAQLANQAADALPPDSQAFAAVLCQANAWLINREPELARPYYRRYLTEGKTQTWHKDFGAKCPAPKWAG